MKILITGRDGFIARHLVKKLAPRHDIRTTIKTDDVVQILNEFNPEYIFHLGAELADQERMFETNVVLTMKILEWARDNPVKRVVLFGSSSEYGRSPKPRAETDCPMPDTIYEGTKAATAMLARAWSYTYRIPITFIRPFTIYGPDEKPTKLTQILFQKWLDGSCLELSEGVHDYVYIEDFIQAMCTVAFWEETDVFNMVNIGSGVQYSNSEFVMAFQEQIGYHFPIKLVKNGKKYDSRCWVADSNLLENKYKITFGKLNWGLKRLVADFINGPGRETHRHLLAPQTVASRELPNGPSNFGSHLQDEKT
mgnify:CR=1 FL=1